MSHNLHFMTPTTAQSWVKNGHGWKKPSKCRLRIFTLTLKRRVFGGFLHILLTLKRNASTFFTFTNYQMWHTGVTWPNYVLTEEVTELNWSIQREKINRVLVIPANELHTRSLAVILKSPIYFVKMLLCIAFILQQPIIEMLWLTPNSWWRLVHIYQ